MSVAPLASVRGAFARRRPLIRIIPHRRLASVVAGLALLWLIPGRIGTLVALAALGFLALLVAVDWQLLPRRGDVQVTREVPATTGIGDQVQGRYTIVSAWPRELSV